MLELTNNIATKLINMYIALLLSALLLKHVS